MATMNAIGSDKPIEVTFGGTAAATLTDNGVLYGNGTAAIGATAEGATGTILVGNTTFPPFFSATPTITSLTATTVNATTFDTNVAAAGVTLAGSSLVADGTDADVNIYITPKGTGSTIITNPSFSGDLIVVSDGGTGTNSLTNHGVLLGSGAGSITALAVGTTGTILQGSTGADPVWTTTTYPATATKGDIISASATNVFTSITAGTDNHVLTANGAGEVSTYQYSHALPVTVVNDTSTAWTAILSSAGKLITLNNAAAITATIPPNASVAFEIGTQILFQALGAGQVTLTPGTAVTFRSADDAYKLVKQHSVACVVKIASDTWLVAGDTEA